MFYSFFKSYLFLLEPEKAHEKVYYWLEKISYWNLGKKLLSNFYGVHNLSLKKEIMGLPFKNPVGMAAGFDKNAEWINILPLLGFGFMEIGTVTPLPQDGNPKPRLFRLPHDKALLNRMGFNNKGMKEIKKNLQKKNFSDFIIGVNIGKNKSTSNDVAYEDYCKCLEYLYEDGDYFVMNISSPNTPNLRDLQQKDALKTLIEPVQNLNIKLGNKPLLIKIAPDLSYQNLNDLVEISEIFGIQGLIVSNTTIQKENLIDYKQEMGDGGISGKPVQNIANELIKYLRSMTKIPIIGVGGIMNPHDAIHKLELGADLIQVYTGYVYYGPSLAKDICTMVLKRNLLV